MALSLYNDLTRHKEPFKPIVPGEARFYVCGPTVYDYFHIGNARPFILFDVLRRYLIHLGYRVTYVQNFTDIDDKMINRAREMGITVDELAERFIAAYYEDADALGIRRADVNPRATREIPAILELVSRLVERGYAYEVEGDVYFHVPSFPKYGKLTRQSLDELQSGARVDVDPRKRHPLDFALWKAQKPGEPAWDSPWGPGRPGWHIECSAMAGHHLGETIDIHGGGSDLIFPHHENEIAQSEAANGKPFVHYWVHNGYLMIDREKMSKSLGNFLTAREARKKFPPLAIRLFMLSAHYRSPISFSEEGLLQARAGTERLRNGRAELLFALERRETGSPDETLREAIRKARTDFEVSMEDDFNTAGALGTLFEAIRAVNTHLGARPDMDREGLDSARAFLTVAEEVLGVLGNEEETVDPEGLSDRAVQARIDERNAARRAKDFARSDAIRDELAAGGIILEDTPQGTRFKRT
jgi:cysteinyl-tRNA synthetase